MAEHEKSKKGNAKAAGHDDLATLSAGVDPNSESAQAQSAEIVQLAHGSPTAADSAAIKRAAPQGFQGSSGALPHFETIQKAFGQEHDLSGVASFVGGPSKEACTTMGASAYTSGDKVAFQRSPDVKLAAHEAAHVVQQKAGAKVPGGVGKTGDAFEQNADAVAERVAAGRSAKDLLARFQPGQGTEQVQRENRGVLVPDTTQIPDLGESERLGGHCLERHGPSVKLGDLKKRVMGTHATMPQSRTALKFPSQSAMIQALKAVFKKHGSAIQDHFSKGGGEESWEKVNVGAPVGVGFTNTGTRKNPVSKAIQLGEVTKVSLFLKPKSGSGGKCFVWTFFPVWP